MKIFLNKYIVFLILKIFLLLLTIGITSENFTGQKINVKV